jgi:hypothetical protein
MIPTRCVLISKPYEREVTHILEVILEVSAPQCLFIYNLVFGQPDVCFTVFFQSLERTVARIVRSLPHSKI